jgi:hypothetical protein
VRRISYPPWNPQSDPLFLNSTSSGFITLAAPVVIVVRGTKSMNAAVSRDVFRALMNFSGFVFLLIPGAWAAYAGIKALAYYLKLKIDGEKGVY